MKILTLSYITTLDGTTIINEYMTFKQKFHIICKWPAFKKPTFSMIKVWKLYIIYTYTYIRSDLTIIKPIVQWITTHHHILYQSSLSINGIYIKEKLTSTTNYYTKAPLILRQIYQRQKLFIRDQTPPSIHLYSPCNIINHDTNTITITNKDHKITPSTIPK